MRAETSRQPENPLAHGPEAKKAHLELMDNKELWQRLQFQGLFPSVYPGELTEMRCCPACGSTIHRRVSPPEAATLLARQADIQSTSIGFLAKTVAVKAPAGISQ